jgi:hypothetical protein
MEQVWERFETEKPIDQTPNGTLRDPSLLFSYLTFHGVGCLSRVLQRSFDGSAQFSCLL